MNRTDSKPVSPSGSRAEEKTAFGVDRLHPILPPGGIGPAVLPRVAASRTGLWKRDTRHQKTLRAGSSYVFVKRLLDIIVALLFLIMASPLLLSIAVLIWREDQGPVLYSQLRVGRRGKLFRFYKFRSMVRDADKLKDALHQQNEADGPIFKMRDDPRVTRIGRVLRKYSLDELPQFFNVLRGEMSLVGPRPHLPKEVADCPQYPAERLIVPPGLVCLREINGRSRLSFSEWIASDLEYVRCRSLGLDLWILFKLVPAVLRADGAY